MTRPLALVAALLVSAPLAGEVAPQAGAAAPWLKLPSSARALGMADAGAARQGEASNFLANPASLATLEMHEVSLTHADWLRGAFSEQAAFGMPIGLNSGMGLGLNYVDFGSIEGFAWAPDGQSLQSTGQLRPHAMALAAAFSHRLESSLALGMGTRLIVQNLEEGRGAGGLSFDAGAQWTEGDLGLGLALQHLGPPMQDFALPLNVKAGAQWIRPGADSALVLALDLNLPPLDLGAASAGLGCELWLNELFALRAGYRLLRSSSLAGAVSAGLGVRFAFADLNYGFTSFGEAGNAGLLELVARFGLERGLALKGEED